MCCYISRHVLEYSNCKKTGIYSDKKGSGCIVIVVHFLYFWLQLICNMHSLQSIIHNKHQLPKSFAKWITKFGKAISRELEVMSRFLLRFEKSGKVSSNLSTHFHVSRPRKVWKFRKYFLIKLHTLVSY